MIKIEQMQTIVVDNGSGIMKAGFAKDKGPSVILPTIVGHPRKVVGLIYHIKIIKYKSLSYKKIWEPIIFR
jgi:actin-related protein